MENYPKFIDPNKYPNFWDQMKNFKEFTQKVGQDISSGNGILISEEKRLERENICKKCNQYNLESKRCYLCGCFMEHKIKFKASECPALKW
jgi:hypothetical protein